MSAPLWYPSANLDAQLAHVGWGALLVSAVALGWRGGGAGAWRRAGRGTRRALGPNGGGGGARGKGRTAAGARTPASRSIAMSSSIARVP